MTDPTRLSRRGRPTFYRGIPMRSRLEARWAAALDGMGDPWTYEPYCFADQTGQYLPDFRIETTDGVAYLEVKPTISAEEAAAVRTQMEIIWSSEPTAHLWLAAGGTGLWAGNKANGWRQVQVEQEPKGVP